MDPKSRKFASADYMGFSPHLEMGLEGCAGEFLGPKSTKPVPKSGQLVPKPTQPVPKAAQLVPKAAQLVAKSANLIGLRTVSSPKVGPIFKTPDQPPKRPGMLRIKHIKSSVFDFGGCEFRLGLRVGSPMQLRSYSKISQDQHV